jgi:hypothetical protein
MTKGIMPGVGNFGHLVKGLEPLSDSALQFRHPIDGMIGT